MKTTKIRLLATMITLAAVTTITTFSATAQRRSTGRQTNDSAVKKSDESRKRTVQNKSTFKDYNKVERTPRNSSVNKNRTVQQKPATTATRNQTSSRNKQTATKSNNTNRNRSVQNSSSRNNNNKTSDIKRNNTSSKNTERNRDNVYANRGRTTTNTAKVSTERRKTTTSSANKRGESSISAKNRTKYQLDRNDKRYTPNKNYRGNNKTWSGNYRPNKMNYNHNSQKFHKNYNHNKYKHWDHSWERYCWNHNSWRDYYHGYHPHSYRYHENYYHHNYYGHVIRRFVFAPQIFIHNHNRYYSYNGNFFRYHRGVGYVLVDIPFGLTFEYLPYNYEKVYINGYLYFRVGNLFFEYSNFGFQLVHYPERYYAYNNDYRNEGFYYEDSY